jgi:predicted dehydrogenase
VVLRVGIVSAAWGAFAHLPAWRAIPGVEVTAICTAHEGTARAAASRHGIARPFWDALAMCADRDIDIVDLGTRPLLRRPMIEAALAAGKPIYNGCPHAADWAGACAIDAAWRASCSVTAVDAFAQWLPAHRHMKALLDGGYIGAPFGGTARFNLALFNRPSRAFPYLWFANEGQGVSAVRNNGSHLLFLLIHLLGDIEEVVAMDRQMLANWPLAEGGAVPAGTTDCAEALLRFANGAVIQFQASWAIPAAEGWRIDLFGEGGRLVAASPSFPTVRDCTLSGARTGGPLAPIILPDDLFAAPGLALDADAQPAPVFPMALSIQAMVAAIRGEASTPGPGFARALAVERVQEAIRRSSAQRRWVRIDEIIPPGNTP